MKALPKKSKKSSAPKPVVIKPEGAETKKLADKPKSAKKTIKMRTKIIVVLLVLLIAFGLHSLFYSSPNKTVDSSHTQTSSTSKSNLKASVGYTLPDGWNKGTCPAAKNIVYVVPNGTLLSCKSNPSAPIKIYVDKANTTDCKQLVPASTKGVKNHVCSSLFISGHKSLKASTTYGAGGAYATDTTVSDYYINDGKTIIAVEYSYASINYFQAGFDQLATTAVIKK